MRKDSTVVGRSKGTSQEATALIQVTMMVALHHRYSGRAGEKQSDSHYIAEGGTGRIRRLTGYRV